MDEENDDDLEGLLESFELPDEDGGPGFYFPDAPLLDEEWDSDGL